MTQKELFKMGADRESFIDFLKILFTAAEQYSPGTVRESFEEWETEKELEEEMEKEAIGEDQESDF